MSDLLQDQDQIHEPSISVQVHGVPTGEAAKSVAGMYAQIRDVRKYPKLQIIRDQLGAISKVSTNEQMTVQARVNKLNEMGKKFSDGYPFKNNVYLDTFRVDGNPILARQAYAAADQLLSVEKARFGKDVGKMGNQ